jgi:hemerythrin-like domain-containing protein
LICIKPPTAGLPKNAALLTLESTGRTAMTQPAIDTLLQEHRAIATTLRATSRLLDQTSPLTPADFASLRAMLLFLDEFCEREHHHKETELLFAKVRARAPSARRLLDELDHQHVVGEAQVRLLQQSLTAYETFGVEHRQAFADALSRYTCLYLGHMEIEEQQLLPIALQVLTADDWDELQRADQCKRGLAHGPASAFMSLFARMSRAWPREVRVEPWWRDASPPHSRTQRSTPIAH